MSEATMTLQDSNEFYERLRTIPLEDWISRDAAELGEVAREAGMNMDGRTPAVVGTSIRLLGRLAHQVDAEAFAEATATGELPPMKLSAEEMEAVRGGLIGTCIACFCLGAYIVGRLVD